MPPSVQVMAFLGARSAGAACTDDADGVVLGVCAFGADAVDGVGREDATPKGVYGRSRWQPLHPGVEARHRAASALVVASESVRPTIPARLFGRAHTAAIVNIPDGSDRRSTMASVECCLGVLGAGYASKFLRLVPRPRLGPSRNSKASTIGEEVGERTVNT
jgi:hypothetical protein